MLLRQQVLAGLRDGSVTLAFRRWDRPIVKPGGRFRTAIGVLQVDSVEPCDVADITEEDARRAGASSVAEIVRMLSTRDGQVYRVTLSYAGPDPRVALREDDALSDTEWAQLRTRLARLDKASPRGPWTQQILELIAARPEVRAVDLAASIGRDRASFKLDVRKLKELGLTESLNPGYRLSPRGRALLARLDGGCSGDRRAGPRGRAVTTASDPPISE